MIKRYSRHAKLSTILVFISLLVLNSCILAPDLGSDRPIPADEQLAQLASSRDNPIFDDFITSIYQAAPQAKQSLVDSFIRWADSTTGIPYIEDSTAYFMYSDNGTNKVQVAGDFNDWTPGNTFNSVSGTNFFYRSYAFEMDARLDYKLIVDESWILDPLNPHTCSGGWGPNSELSMSDYVQPEEIQTYDIPHGELITTNFSDSTQGRTRGIRIYLPPGYSEGQLHYRTAYFLDGGEFVTLASAPNVLDYLIHNEMIPPVIAVFTDPTNRNEEYRYDLKFMEMFVTELVPWVDSEYRTMTGQENRAIAGVSLGGLTSLLFSLNHPEVFGNCGAYSPAVQIGDLIQNYSSQLDLGTTIYIDAGTYEPSIYHPALELKQILENNSWDHKWMAWHEGHSWGSWRAHLDESLTYFWPMHTTGIDESY